MYLINLLLEILISGKTEEARRSFAWLYGKSPSMAKFIDTDVKLATKLLMKEDSKYVKMKLIYFFINRARYIDDT